MKITTLEFLRLLPEFMREDAAVKALAEAVESTVLIPAVRVKTARVWDQIDRLNDAQLDELAYELDVDWYSADLPIESKRAIIKSSDKVYSKRGTKWAIEQIIKDVFGGGYVTEGNKNNCEPLYFRVKTSYPKTFLAAGTLRSGTNTTANRSTSVLQRATRCRHRI